MGIRYGMFVTNPANNKSAGLVGFGGRRVNFEQDRPIWESCGIQITPDPDETGEVHSYTLKPLLPWAEVAAKAEAILDRQDEMFDPVYDLRIWDFARQAVQLERIGLRVTLSAG